MNVLLANHYHTIEYISQTKTELQYSMEAGDWSILAVLLCLPKLDLSIVSFQFCWLWLKAVLMLLARAADIGAAEEGSHTSTSAIAAATGSGFLCGGTLHLTWKSVFPALVREAVNWGEEQGGYVFSLNRLYLHNINTSETYKV